MKTEKSPTAGSRPSAEARPIVVGLYGISGCGKTHLLNQLKSQLGHEQFAYYDGSDVINSVFSQGIEAFKHLPEEDQRIVREKAIDKIGEECRSNKTVGIVAGHYMFWREKDEAGKSVWTQCDGQTYSHILYLSTPAKTVASNIQGDNVSTKRQRMSMSVEHLEKWQQAEKTELRRICLEHGILFSCLSIQPNLSDKTAALIRDFRLHNEDHNIAQAKKVLDQAMSLGNGQFETMLVLDADKTLAAEDAGDLFRQKAGLGDSLKELFGSQMEYSYAAFRQAALLFEEIDDAKFEASCRGVASNVSIHPEFKSLLRKVNEKEHVGAIVVTCGLRRVWELALESQGLGEKVKVIGGGRISDGYVVNAAVKAVLVESLQDSHNCYVWAFGDSRLDLDMMAKADQAIVVTGDKHTRSKSMETALGHAIDKIGLQARQVLLPSDAPPRLDTVRLPLIRLGEVEIDHITSRRKRHQAVQVADKNVAKVLQTPMRNADNSGPTLRESHRLVGWYLATAYLAGALRTETFKMKHVQAGKTCDGYRILDESRTLIVPLMRGGEPMAFGVSEALPAAMFRHAKEPEDLGPEHLQGCSTIVLVDSVVNTGKSTCEFIDRIRRLNKTVRIVVVSGVVQKDAVAKVDESILAKKLDRDPRISLIALRLSDNKYKGKGGTDTGHRLFNTTHLD